MNLPNILTMVRIALIPVFMILAAMDNRMAQLAAVAVYAIACITDFVDGYGIIQLIIADAYYAVDFYFNADAMDPTIGVPAGVYPINPSFDSGTVLACKGVLPDGPAQSYFCGLDAEGYLDPLQLYCLVDGTVTVENVDGKLKVEVDAVNSYDVPVTLHYVAAGATAVENVNKDNTQVAKRLVNGQLLIIRNGETYNATGALVK